jgi:hypothetical protein
MLDKLLTIGAGFDWISPVASVLDELLFGPVYTFLIPVCHLTGHEITSYLHKKGVPTKTAMIVDNTIMINVRMTHAVAAQIQLNILGVPVLNPLPKKKRRSQPQKREVRKPRKRRRRTMGSYQCGHCDNRYLSRRTKCKNCGAPM